MYELELLPDMRDVNAKKKKTLKKHELFETLCKYSKKTNNELQFKLIILDIRSISPKKGYKKIKKVLNMKMKELTI